MVQAAHDLLLKPVNGATGWRGWLSRARHVVTGALEWDAISKLATLAAAPQAADGR
jgi:hypothetical protein